MYFLNTFYFLTHYFVSFFSFSWNRFSEVLVWSSDSDWPHSLQPASRRTCLHCNQLSVNLEAVPSTLKMEVACPSETTV